MVQYLHKLNKNHNFKIFGLFLLVVMVMTGIAIEHPEVFSTPFFLDANSASTIKQIEISLPKETPIVEEETHIQESDPLVQCRLRECGTVQMKSSQCKLSGCCVIGNEYRVMKDQNECNRLQSEYVQNSNSSNSKSQSQKDLILKNAQNNANYYLAQTCIGQVRYESERCLDDCHNQANEGSVICRQAVDGLGWTTEKYSECLNDVSGIDDECGKTCLETSKAKSDECLAKQKQ